MCLCEGDGGGGYGGGGYGGGGDGGGVEKVGVEMETVEEAKSVFLLNSFCFILLSKLRSFISLL